MLISSPKAPARVCLLLLFCTSSEIGRGRSSGPRGSYRSGCPFGPRAASSSEEIERAVEIDLLSYFQLPLGLHHVVKKHLQNDCASEASSLDLKL